MTPDEDLYINGRARCALKREASCASACDTLSSCIGYAWATSGTSITQGGEAYGDSFASSCDGRCFLYGPGLDQGLTELQEPISATEWEGYTYQNSEIVSADENPNAVCKVKDLPDQELHGTSTPEPITADGSILVVQLVADDVDQAEGFDATFSCVAPSCSLADASARCKTEDDCTQIGAMWAGGTCTPPCGVYNFAACDTQTDCEAKEGLWSQRESACGEPCGSENIGVCSTEKSCIAAGAPWIGGGCGDPCTTGSSLHDGGSFSDGEGQYSNMAQCYWSFFCSNATSVPQLTFRSFDLESSYDFANIFYGDQAVGAPHESLSGSSIPAPIVSTVPVLVVQLVTDQSVEGQGFDGDLECVNPCHSARVSSCVTEADCIGAGGRWSDQHAVCLAPCGAYNVGACQTETECTAVGLEWSVGGISAGGENRQAPFF